MRKTGGRGRLASEDPWTWEEIAALRDLQRLSLDQLRVRGRFLRDYGDRARAALMAAGRVPGEWGPCVLGASVCEGCPLNRTSSWRRSPDKLYIDDSCSRFAMEVYARMVEKLGRLPEEEGR